MRGDNGGIGGRSERKRRRRRRRRRSEGKLMLRLAFFLFLTLIRTQGKMLKCKETNELI